MQKKMKLALKLGIQTYQILTNDDEVCIPCLSSILLAVPLHTSLIRLFLDYVQRYDFITKRIEK
jgi:hypothetical protein